MFQTSCFVEDLDSGVLLPKITSSDFRQRKEEEKLMLHEYMEGHRWTKSFYAVTTVYNDRKTLTWERFSCDYDDYDTDCDPENRRPKDMVFTVADPDGERAFFKKVMTPAPDVDPVPEVAAVSIWNCVHCTFENPMSANLCEMCASCRSGYTWTCAECTVIHFVEIGCCNVCNTPRVM